jgi:effector-binding domain-containing protein
MRWILLAVVVGILGLAINFALRIGAFKEVTVTMEEQGPFKVVSRKHEGAYHKIVGTIEAVEKWAKANGEACKDSFGEFLDDPKVVDEDRLRSNAGCVVEKDWTTGLPEGSEFRTLPRRQYVVAKFDGAPGIGPLKVYPRAFREIEERQKTLDGPIIEMYEILPGEKVLTTYLFPIKP